MAEGYIKLARELLEKPILQNPKLLQTWIWCLLKASHANHDEMIGLRKVSLTPGQFVTGRYKGASELKMNPNTFWKYLQWLKDNQSLDIKSNNKFSLVTIVNWGLYQVEMFKDNTKNNSKITTKEQQNNTNKNVKNGKNDLKDIINNYTTNFELANTINSFIEMRKKIKKSMTDHALELILKNLDKLSTNDFEKIEILNQSIMNSWQGVFPLKRQNPKMVSDEPESVADRARRLKEKYEHQYGDRTSSNDQRYIPLIKDK